MRSRLFLFLVFTLCASTVAACGTPPTTSGQWTAQHVLDAFRKAGLSVEDAHVPSNDEGLPQTAGAEAITFRITQPTGQATGYIFSLPSAQAAEQLHQSAMSFSPPVANGFASRTFTHDNIYVMLFGSVSEEVLQHYEEAVKTLK
jgi:hypothetical protein